VHELHVGHFFLFHGAAFVQKRSGRHVQSQRFDDEGGAVDFLHPEDPRAQIVGEFFAEFLGDTRERLFVNPFRVCATIDTDPLMTAARRAY